MAEESSKERLTAKRTIGIIHSGTEANTEHEDLIDAFLDGLSRAGYDDSNTNILDPVYADNVLSNLDKVANDMVAKGLDVLVAAGGTGSAEAAQKAIGANTTPKVVFTSVSESKGYPSSMTGVCAQTSALDPDRLELLSKLLTPPQNTIGVITNSERANFRSNWNDLQAKATSLSINLVRKDIPSTVAAKDLKPELRKAFQALGPNPPVPAVPTLVMADPFFNEHRRQIVKIASRYKVPIMCQWREFANAGALMSYGTKFKKAYRIAGYMTGMILDGKSPPVRQLDPELVINLVSAKRLKITIPEELLVLADDTI